MTLSLRELQQAFAAGVLDDESGVLAALRPLRFEPARHLQVYRNNTFANLTDALVAVYPVVQRLVGAGFFGYLADRYIRSHPPRSGNLHDFGAGMAGFVAAFEPASALVYLPAWHEAFHAAEAGVPDPARLAALTPDQCLRLHPSARLLASNYPVLRIWEANQDEPEHDATIDLGAGGEWLLIIRRQLEVLIERLSPGDYRLLQASQRGVSLESACEQALAAEPGLDLAAALRRHLTRGTFTGFEPAAD
jgi:hypothetical protein